MEKPAFLIFKAVLFLLGKEAKFSSKLMLKSVSKIENPHLLLSFLFFAVYVIYKKNYSFSRVVFLFFFSAKPPTLFIQKLMTAVGLGQRRSQAVGLGFESLPGQNFLRFIPNIF